MTRRIARLCGLLVLFASGAFAAGEGRQVAITIDDLPRGGFSWIHRWSRTKGMAPKGEPDPPDWVTKALEDRR